MTVAFPTGLRGQIRASKARSQGAVFRMPGARQGYGHLQASGADVPVVWDARFLFTASEAQTFLTWFRTDLLRGLYPFTLPVRTEFGVQTLTVRFMPEGLLDVREVGELFEYTARIVSRGQVIPPEAIEAWLDAGEASVVWDGANDIGTWVLSNGDRTAYAQPPSVPFIMATVSRNSGKRYVEILRVTSEGSYSSAVRDNHGLAQGTGSRFASSSIHYRRSGNIYLGSTSISSAPALSPGDVIGIAVDLTAGTVWMSRNGVWVTGNPGAGTSPLTSSLPAGAYFPASESESGVEHTVTLQAKTSQLTHPVPSGFVAWAA
jgi:hypothetical protein